MNLAVGQIVYAVLKQQAVVYPLQVVTEITEKTLEGEAKTYMVRAGPDPKKVVPIMSIDGELFEGAEAAKAALIARATSSVTQRVEQAVVKAREWYPTGHEAQSSDPLALIMKVDPVSQHTRERPRPELLELAAEFKQEADEGSVVELADGSKAKIRSVKLPDSLQ